MREIHESVWERFLWSDVGHATIIIGGIIASWLALFVAGCGLIGVMSYLLGIR